MTRMYRDPLLISGLPSGQTKAAWEELGFHFGDKGTPTSPTMLLDEQSTLFRLSDPVATRAYYAKALVEDNCLGKTHLFHPTKVMPTVRGLTK